MTTCTVIDFTERLRLKRCQAGGDQTALPQQFSYPKKQVSLIALVITTPELFISKLREYVGFTWIAPFYWHYYDNNSMPVQLQFAQWDIQKDELLYIVDFGFDTADEALAVQAKFEALGVPAIILDLQEKHESLRRGFEQIEKENGQCPIYWDDFDGCGAIYWRDQPCFQGGLSNNEQEQRERFRREYYDGKICWPDDPYFQDGPPSKNEHERRESVRRVFERIEAERGAQPIFWGADDDREVIYWRDHPDFQEEVSMTEQERREMLRRGFDDIEKGCGNCLYWGTPLTVSAKYTGVTAYFQEDLT